MALDPRVRFGLKLIEIRKTKGWSQERLALESGLARSYLGGVERGQRNIALLNIFKLAEALEEFRQRYNEQWLVERLHFQSPRQAHQTLLALEAAA